MINGRNKKGFTLLELIIALAIITIIAALATVVYTTFVRKGRRVDAINTVLAISLAQENYRSSHTTYGNLTQVWGGVTATTGGYYALSITNNTATSYTITATAQGNQANDSVNSTSCSSMQLAVSNGTVTKTPAVCWPD